MDFNTEETIWKSKINRGNQPATLREKSQSLLFRRVRTILCQCSLEFQHILGPNRQPAGPLPLRQRRLWSQTLLPLLTPPSQPSSPLYCTVFFSSIKWLTFSLYQLFLWGNFFHEHKGMTFNQHVWRNIRNPVEMDRKVNFILVPKMLNFVQTFFKKLMMKDAHYEIWKKYGF